MLSDPIRAVHDEIRELVPGATVVAQDHGLTWVTEVTLSDGHVVRGVESTPLGSARLSLAGVRRALLDQWGDAARQTVVVGTEGVDVRAGHRPAPDPYMPWLPSAVRDFEAAKRLEADGLRERARAEEARADALEVQAAEIRRAAEELEDRADNLDALADEIAATLEQPRG